MPIDGKKTVVYKITEAIAITKAPITFTPDNEKDKISCMVSLHGNAVQIFHPHPKNKNHNGWFKLTLDPEKLLLDQYLIFVDSKGNKIEDLRTNGRTSCEIPFNLPASDTASNKNHNGNMVDEVVACYVNQSQQLTASFVIHIIYEMSAAQKAGAVKRQ
eukprot:1031749-Rhodomonas_salina.7